jgi:hypothetical protein
VATVPLPFFYGLNQEKQVLLVPRDFMPRFATKGKPQGALYKAAASETDGPVFSVGCRRKFLLWGFAFVLQVEEPKLSNLWMGRFM